MKQQNLLDWKTAMQEIGVIEAAAYIGFSIDNRAGNPKSAKWIEMVREPERIIVYNGTPANQHYYKSRNDNKSQNLIDFLREHIGEFANKTGVVGRNINHTINLVITALKPQLATGTNLEMVTKGYEAQPFNPDEYRTSPIHLRPGGSIERFFSTRGITMETVTLFSNQMVYIEDLQHPRTNKETGEALRSKDGQILYIKNLGFPYHEAGKSQITGYELRGLIPNAEGKFFKGKTRGSSSNAAVWALDAYGGTQPEKIRKVYFAESALDIMAMVQTNRETLDLNTSAFVSVGGSFSYAQVTRTMRHYGDAVAVDCFDNDIPGRIMAARMAVCMEGCTPNITHHDGVLDFTIRDKSFTIPEDKLTLPELNRHFRLNKGTVSFRAPAPHKDWNDVTMTTPQPIHSREDMQNNLRAKRQALTV